MPDAPEGQEFFYLDGGNKQDAELHATIINPVDYPIDEKIMAPIRKKNRAAYLADQKTKMRSLRWIRVKAKAEATIAKWDEEDHPRAPAGEPDGGQFTSGDGGEGGGGSGDGGGGGSGESAPAVPGYNPGVRGRGEVEVKARRDEWVAASPIKTIDHVVHAAPIAQKTFAEAGRKIAAELGIQFKDPGPKTSSAKGIERTKQKIAERKGLSARVTDTARGAFILNSPDQADDVIRKLGRTHEVLAEPWRTIPESSYTDRALLFRDRQTGLIGEVQITESKMAAAKKIGHGLYEKARTLPKGPEQDALNAEMKAIYDKVLDGYKGTPWQDVDGRSRIMTTP